MGDKSTDVYFSADVETDGPIPGPYSMLSFALVHAGSFDGFVFKRPTRFDVHFTADLKPISDRFQQEALDVNKLDRARLIVEGQSPEEAMTRAANWVRSISGDARPVMAAYPLSFDWTWLYWYFIQFSSVGSPFNHSGCFDIKTAYAVKARVPIAEAGRSQLVGALRPVHRHTHNALDDAIEQAEIFVNLFEWHR